MPVLFGTFTGQPVDTASLLDPGHCYPCNGVRSV